MKRLPNSDDIQKIINESVLTPEANEKLTAIKKFLENYGKNWNMLVEMGKDEYREYLKFKNLIE